MVQNMLRVSPPDMRLGDVVHTYGMRVLLDREPLIDRSHNVIGDDGEPLPVYSWRGLVLNPQDGIDYGVPRSWLYEDRRPMGGADESHEPRWTVQGNRVATYEVERDGAGQ